MFGPTASPVVHCQSTWHIGPTTYVLTPRSFARVESDGSSEDSSHSRNFGSSASTQRASATASPASLQTKHEARVIRSYSTYVRIAPAASAAEVRKLGHIGLVPVLVGDDPASDVYIRLKHKAATEAGFDATDLRLPADTTEEALLAKLDELNGSDDVDAILVQLPLPDHFDEARIIRAVTPSKYI